MTLLQTGVVGTSNKENEHRVPIHPCHLDRIPTELRDHLVFERGYGAPFGVADDDLAAACGGLADRDTLLADFELVLLPKPLAMDLRLLREGSIMWSWPHCVQQREITQVAIDRRQTLLAFEAMFRWRQGRKGLHILYKNNELAGYCSVLHALELVGRDGYYGPRQSVAVLSFGSVARGAVYALRGRGFSDLRIYTQRPSHLVADQVPGCTYLQMGREDGPVWAQGSDGRRRPLLDDLAGVDVIVNGILQDTDDPLMFLTENELDRLRPGTLIVDVSCDEGMGFPFARPTSFEDPMFDVGPLRYYAVDHTPTYLWDAASWEISEALLPYLETVMRGPEAWEKNETLRRAVEIREGGIVNPKILSFQHREKSYPHPIRAS